MKTALHRPETIPFHVRIFSQAELRSLMLMAIAVAVVFDLFH